MGYWYFIQIACNILWASSTLSKSIGPTKLILCGQVYCSTLEEYCDVTRCSSCQSLCSTLTNGSCQIHCSDYLKYHKNDLTASTPSSSTVPQSKDEMKITKGYFDTGGRDTEGSTDNSHQVLFYVMLGALLFCVVLLLLVISCFTIFLFKHYKKAESQKHHRGLCAHSINSKDPLPKDLNNQLLVSSRSSGSVPTQDTHRDPAHISFLRNFNTATYKTNSN